MKQKKHKLFSTIFMIFLIMSIHVGYATENENIQEDNIAKDIPSDPQTTSEVIEQGDIATKTNSEEETINNDVDIQIETEDQKSPLIEDEKLEFSTEPEGIDENLSEEILEENSTIVHTSENKTTEENYSESEAENAQYIEIEQVQNSGSGTSSTNTIIEENKENEQEENSKATVKLELFKEGKKEIEGTIPENYEGRIQKEEKELSTNENWEKEVTVKSEEHLEAPLIVYTNIQKVLIEDKDLIKIHWENENKEIKIIDYIDEDNDGFIERISWIVPHLSEQVFTISIEIAKLEQEFDIEVVAPEGVAKNPVEFELKVNNSNLSKVSCTLKLDSDSYNLTNLNEIFSINKELGNGKYNWTIICSNTTNTIEKKGTFEIDEIFEISNLNKVYLSGENISFSLPTGYDSNTVKIIKPDSTYEELTFTKKDILIDKSKITSEGLYKMYINASGSAKPLQTEEVNFSIVRANLKINDTEINEEENVKINVDISSIKEEIKSIVMDFGDGYSNIDFLTLSGIYSKNYNFYHTYDEKGTYTPKLKMQIGDRNFEVTNNSIEVESNIDTTAPTISLIEPANNEIVNTSDIVFAYSANDEIKITNCTYELYNQSGIIGILEYNVTHTNIDNDERIEIPMYSFDEGDYSWYITCVDNSSNEYTKKATFEVSFGANSISQTFGTHENKEEIEEIKTDLESFLLKTNSFSEDELNALEELGIMDDLKYYQKRLVQIDQDLGNNIKFISDENLREQKRQTMLKELEEIKEDIPKEMKIKEESNFIKNSLSNPLEEIITKYYESQKIEINKKTLKSLTKTNEELQNEIIVSTKITKILLTYPVLEKEITLVTKEIDTKNNNPLLEILPEEITGVNFITDTNELSKNLFEIDQEDLEENKLIYFIEEDISTNQIKNTDTILFIETPKEQNSITGYFLIDLEETINPFYAGIILILLVLLFVVVINRAKKVKKKKWKKDANIRKSYSCIKEAKKSLEKGNINVATEEYHKLKTLYPGLPADYKKYIYSKIEKLRIEIDKKEIKNLMQEYEKAKEEKRIIDANKIYKHIQKVYTRLPKKYQSKVYERMFDDSLDL